MIASRTPRTIWVELTSKCPLDCVFCSRKTRRGVGDHMPYELFESLVSQVSDPRTFLLNYSGESTVYPELIPAIRLARSTGAFVELVSALVNVPEAASRELSSSGLNRLTVSLHTTNAARYRDIYRYGSFEELRARLSLLLESRHRSDTPLAVDLAFVAMDRNLEDLPSVAAFAASMGLRSISVFPVLRRDQIPERFPSELTELGVARPGFQERVAAAVKAAASHSPEVSIRICDPSFTVTGATLGESPIPYPGPLPDGASIHSCEQNPWETAHVLANGDVVACEQLDKIPLGNLARQSLSEIWRGEAYRAFREQYARGATPECRACPWKLAYRPGAVQSEIIGSRGRNAQLWHGWHAPDGEAHVWASQQALAVIAPREGSRALRLSGMLPPGPPGSPNELAISCNGAEAARVGNSGTDVSPFALELPVSPNGNGPWRVEFRTRHMYRPSERGDGPDQRDLGFALGLLASQPFVDPEEVARREKLLRPLPYIVRGIDAAGRAAARCLRHGRADGGRRFAPGLSVLIPERDNAAELAECLASVRQAAARLSEPTEVIVLVNGSPPFDYEMLRARHPEARWRFFKKPLGFGGAVRAGLRAVRHDWTYLLNSDVALDAEALAQSAVHRHAGIFSIASRIRLKDPTKFQDETNWTKLFIDDGLVTIHDCIADFDETVPGFYAGGGASLFQTRLLRQFARVSAYDPFYWEDVEWGWRARKLGYGSLFCPTSVAHHTRRSTISRAYPPEEIERIWARNRLLFQLRNFTEAGSLRRVGEELARSAGMPALNLSTLWKIANGRLWNHLAPVPDSGVLAVLNSALSAPR